ncbi:MAG: hypothetical protein HY765_00875 [Rhodomicrobium sp.]|nr:hypothetical protein [Rhodomicrobium sp.]
MTREKEPAAQSAARRAASLLTGALMIAGVAGCSSSLFQFSDTADASLTQKAKPAVALASVEGVPQKYASRINNQLATSIKAKGIVLVDAKDAQYIIKPSFLALPEPKQGTKVTYTVDVTDKAGNKVRSIGGEELVSAKRGGDSWNHVTDEGVEKVAAKSAADINSWIENPNVPLPSAVASAAPAAAPVKTAAHAAHKPAAKPVQTASLAASVATPAAAPARHKVAALPGEVVAVVPAVTGAPGDGKTSLAEAMKRALGRQGIKTVAAAHGAYKIQGQVELGAATNGQQPITIRWIVVDPAGKQMEKTVVQNNKVATGSLDGTWGDIADQAAGAAASEVTKLLQKSSGQAQQATNGSAG